VLKKELQARGLEGQGLKSELVARLTEAIAKETPSDASKTESSASAAPQEAKTAIEKSPVVAVGNGSSVATSKAAAPVASDSAAGSSGSSDAVSEEERKKQRAARFGVAVQESEEERLKKRAARFGGVPSDRPKLNIGGALFKHSVAGLSKDREGDTLTPEKLEERAKRFGISAPNEDKKKLEDRSKRFGVPVASAGTSGNLTWSKEDDERKRKRAERFQSTEKKQKTDEGAITVDSSQQ